MEGHQPYTRQSLCVKGLDMQAIPTVYRGIQMRSRLEAKWASFFDRCSWRWDYEAIDLGGWIPDFVVTGPRKRSLLVECKPIEKLNPAVCQKIVRTGAFKERDILICGSGLTHTRIFGTDVLGIGWLLGDDGWQPTCLVHLEDYPDTWQLFFAGEFPAFIEANRYFAGYGSIIAIWAAATNSAQWKAPR